MLVQETAVRRWIRPGETRPLRDLLAEALQSLRAVTGEPSPDRPPPGRRLRDAGGGGTIRP